MTDAERRLWQQLRARQLGGFKFRRQQPVGPFIADFVCVERMLVVELDGSQHLDSGSDRRRDAWFAREGYRVLRFWNNEALGRTGVVLEVILAALASGGPHPSPPPQAGEGAECGYDGTSPQTRRNPVDTA